MTHARIVLACLAVSFATDRAHAQCTPGWDRRFRSHGADGGTSDAVVFDDGSGAALYIAGAFDSVNGVVASRIARFDGSTWTALATEIDGPVDTLAVFDDGTGAKLYAGGSFTRVDGVPAVNVASWDGNAWSTLGSSITGDAWEQSVYAVRVLALEVYTPPNGPTSLYAAGWFPTADGAPVANIARWDGVAWSSVGAGIANGVGALAVHDADGDGGNPAELYAASGFYDTAGPHAVLHQWNGTSWNALPGSIDQSITELTSYDPPGAATPLLVAAGELYGSADSVFAWDGAGWIELSGSSSVNDQAFALCVFDAGTGHGRALYAAKSSGLEPATLKRWTGADWIVEATIQRGGVYGLDRIEALVSAVAPGTGVQTLYALGQFGGVDDVVSPNFAHWNGTSWSGFPARGQGIGGQVDGFAVHDDGSGRALYVTGEIAAASGATVPHGVLKWNGSSFTSVGSNLYGYPYELCSFDDGSGPVLFAAGQVSVNAPLGPFTLLARWNGSTWTEDVLRPTSSNLEVALSVFDDGSGPALYVGGPVRIGDGGPSQRLVRWDGVDWSVVPGAPSVGVITTLVVHDDGSGEALYAGGSFTQAGGQNIRYIARWDGTTWSELSGLGSVDTLNNAVSTLTVFDFGSGPELVAGGKFTVALGQPMRRISRWNGVEWKSIGEGFVTEPSALLSYDDGAGSKLIAAFDDGFNVSGLMNLAAWDGTTWAPFAGGVNSQYVGGSSGIVTALAKFDDLSGSGESLWVGGGFTLVDGAPSFNVARYVACSDAGDAFCFGDGSATACPCGNDAPLGALAGCKNSNGSSASLGAIGRASLADDGVRLEVSRLTPFVTCQVFQGSALANGGSGFVNGDGLMCAGGALKRIATRQASAQGTLSYPTPADPDLHVAGDVLQPGLRSYQVYYRDAAAFCTSATFNLTNGFSVEWNP